MTVTEEIQNAIREEADMHMAEVIQRAFSKIGCYCPNCNYPQNAESFENGLYYYTHFKREMHYYEKYLDGRGENSIRWSVLKWECGRNAQKLYHQSVLDMVNWQDRISDIRPCLDCKKKFNPTSRVKYGKYCKPTKPEKGFLDYE